MQVAIPTLKGLIAKSLKKFEGQIDLEPGTYELDQDLIISISGSLTKLEDENAVPTVKVPQLAVMATLLRRMGATRPAAISLLKECLRDCMDNDCKMQDSLKKEVADIETAINEVKEEVLKGQPKMHRDGKILASKVEVKISHIVPQEEEAVA